MRDNKNNCCDVNTTNCCDTSSAESNCCDTSMGCCDRKEYNVTVDGRSVEVKSEDKNLVDVLDRAGIPIPAPCYRNGRKSGCCKACLVESNGKEKYACSALPEEGADIIVDREDLNNLRKERLKIYSENIKNGTFSKCSK